VRAYDAFETSSSEGQYATSGLTGSGAKMLIAHGTVGEPMASGGVAVRLTW